MNCIRELGIQDDNDWGGVSGNSVAKPSLCLMTRWWWPQVKSSEPPDRYPKQETHCIALYLISWNIRMNGLKNEDTEMGGLKV